MAGRVFWALSIGFLVGVFIRSFVPLGTSVVLFLALLAAAAYILSRVEYEIRSALLLAALFCISCGLGIERMQFAAHAGDPTLNALVGSHIALEGTIQGEPDARETATLVHLSARMLDSSSTIPISADLLVTLPPHADVSYGDLVRASGTLELPQPFDTGFGRQFAYPEYLASQGIDYQLSFAQIDREGSGGNPIEAAAFKVKELFEKGIRASLPEPEAGLAGGITVGDKRSIGTDLSLAFQRDSLIHMVVLSGYNITVVLNAIVWAMRYLPRTAQFGGSIGVVTFFILISGGASSATRAGVMALIAVFARATHRIYLGERALVVTVVAMVMWNPYVLAFDPSLQLSALATLGLILFTPIFSRWFVRVPERFGIREILASTCATQLMVLPLLLYQNGTLSLVSLPANLLALIPVPFAMALSSIAALAGLAFGGFGAIVALPAYVLLRYIIAIAQFFAGLPFAAFSLPAFSAWWLLFAYGLMTGALWIGKTRARSSDTIELESYGTT